VPPVERPSAGVAAKKGRERPRLRRANAAPRPSTGSLTPLVSVSIMVTGAGIVQAQIVPAIGHRMAIVFWTDGPRGRVSNVRPIPARFGPPHWPRSRVAPASIFPEHTVRVKASLAPLAACAALTRPVCSRLVGNYRIDAVTSDRARARP
jgi:hypothetical protein